MTRRERLMATLRGLPVDRPAVSFYEIGGFAVDPADPDPFNVYNSPDWQPLLALAEKRTDLIRMRAPPEPAAADTARADVFRHETWTESDSRFTRTTCRVAGRELTALSRRDAPIATTWTLEHLLKSPDDVKAFLSLPDEVFARRWDMQPLIDEDRALGDAGILMGDIADPLCLAAANFSMQDYTIIAMTEQKLFHALLEKLARPLHACIEEAAAAFPGLLWRVYGSEYASEPYLPPALYREYEVRYTRPIVDAIRRHGGFTRIHSHGRLRAILPDIVAMGAAALDPVEPPPQGDMTLAEVRRQAGAHLVLFGNLESSDIESLPPPAFEEKVARALREGTAGQGRGFVLMPSACPYGRSIAPHTLANYETMVRLAEQMA